MSRKTFKYRLYPTAKQEQTLLFFLRRCHDLYNAGLEQRKAYYQMRHNSLSCYTQINELPDLKRAYPAYREVPSHVLQAIPGSRVPVAITVSPILTWLAGSCKGTA
jgi:putative transposase